MMAAPEFVVKIMIAVFIGLLVVCLAIWIAEQLKTRRQRAGRKRSMEKQIVRRRRQEDSLQRQRDREARRANWVLRFIWKGRRAKRITYQPTVSDEDRRD